MYSDSTLIPYNNGWFFTAPDQPGGGLTEIPPAAVPVKLPHAWNEIGWSYENLKPDEPGGSGYYYKRLENSSPPTPFKCYTGYNSIRIDSDGAVSSCMFMPEVGNIKKTGLKEIWISNDYDSHRKAIKQCNRPCALNCYYPVSLPGLINEFAILPAKRSLGL